MSNLDKNKESIDEMYNILHKLKMLKNVKVDLYHNKII